jgi:hypothetical protein
MTKVSGITCLSHLQGLSKKDPRDNPEDFKQRYDHGGSLQLHTIKLSYVTEIFPFSVLNQHPLEPVQHLEEEGSASPRNVRAFNHYNMQQPETGNKTII